VVSVNDPELLRQTVHLGDRPAELFRFLEPLLGPTNIQNMPASAARENRAMLVPALGHSHLLRMAFGQMIRQTRRLEQRWRSAALRGEEVASQKDLTELSMNIIGSVALGQDFAQQEATVRITTSFNNVLLEFLTQQYQLPSALSAEERRQCTEQSLRCLNETVDQIILERQAVRAGEGEAPTDPASRAFGGRADLLETLLERQLPIAEVRMIVLAVLLGGFHTSGVAIAWTLYLLSQHPEVLDRVQAEVDRVFADRDELRYEDVERLEYLTRVLKESMRRYSPAPYAARLLREPLSLGGYDIPAGTTLLYPIWAVHMNPAVWPDPERFDPDRFEEKEESKRPNLAYIPFGFGARACSGMRLAMLGLKVPLAVLLHRFRFRLVPGQDIRPVERLALWSEDDIRFNAAVR
jgi:cytochrome P450